MLCTLYLLSSLLHGYPHSSFSFFGFVQLFSLSFYYIFTFFFFVRRPFLVCIGDNALAQATLVPRSSEPFFSYFLVHGPCIAAVGKGYIQTVLCTVYNYYSGPARLQLFVGGGLTTETLLN